MKNRNNTAERYYVYISIRSTKKSNFLHFQALYPVSDMSEICGRWENNYIFNFTNEGS